MHTEDDEFCDGQGCITCWGQGFIVDCCDDICQGQGYCMHGDGNVVCPDCGGEG